MVEQRLEKLQREHDQLQQEYDKFRQKAIYVGLVLLVVAIVLTGVSLIISSNAAKSAAAEASRQTEIKLCAFLVEARDGYRSDPPSTPAGRRQADLMEKLAGPFPDGFNCDGK